MSRSPQGQLLVVLAHRSGLRTPPAALTLLPFWAATAVDSRLEWQPRTDLASAHTTEAHPGWCEPREARRMGAVTPRRRDTTPGDRSRLDRGSVVPGDPTGPAAPGAPRSSPPPRHAEHARAANPRGCARSRIDRGRIAPFGRDVVGDRPTRPRPGRRDRPPLRHSTEPRRRRRPPTPRPHRHGDRRQISHPLDEPAPHPDRPGRGHPRRRGGGVSRRSPRAQ